MTETAMFLMICDDSWKRAHHALVVAGGAASLGRDVTLFAGGYAVRALARDYSDLTDAVSDDILRAKGVAGFAELRTVLLEMGCRFMACEAGLKLCDLAPSDLMDGAEIRGVVSFLAEAGSHPILSI